MSYDQAASKIRQRIRYFTTESFVLCILSRLHKEHEMGEAFKRPWVLCLAIDWALELDPIKGAKEATQKDVQPILQSMWELQGKAMGIEKERDIWLPLRAFLLSQLRFQVPQITHSFFLLRLYTIMSQLGFKQSFTEDFKKATGVDLDEFFLFAIWIVNHFSDTKNKNLTLGQILVNFHPALTIETISKILKLVGSSIPGLKALAQPLPLPLRPETYFYEPLLIKKPLILLDMYVSHAHPYIVSIGISEFVLRTLKAVDTQRFQKKFTKSFESYVGTTLEESNFTYITEDDINETYKQHNRQGKVIDFLHQNNGSSVFIDAKGVEPKEKLLVTDSPRMIKDKLRDNLLSGVTQGSRCAQILGDIAYKGLAPYENRYSIVVTHQDFYCGSGSKLVQYLGGELSYKVTEASNGQFPIENIHFFSIADFEGMVAVCSKAGKDIAEFLDFCTEQEKEPATQTFDMRQRIEAFATMHNLENASPIGTQLLLSNVDKLLGTLSEKFTHSRKHWGNELKTIPQFYQAVSQLEQALKS
ncbi:hypothetical protein [Vibrio metschnikovii]|uniref:GapS1 family protein n=1 Tax=Vibrio metschnikovii TaxID=28172 RepID=UPI002FC81AA0